MRLFSKILSIILFLFVLSILYLPSVKAGCSFDAYGNCTGTCSCSPYCGSCNCKAFSTSFCIEDKSTCYTCPTNTPKPTNTPQPSDTPIPFTSTTPRPPTATPAPCTSTSECLQYCGSIPNCSAACINGYCVFTNPTINNSQCNTWGNWSGCISGQDACGGCAAQGYTCQTRSCTNPSNANLYQISCGCSQPPGGGGGNPTNTPSPTSTPTPTPTAFLRLRLLNPALSPVASSDVTLCKVRCDTAPCSAVSCQSGVSLADFPGSILADRGGAIRDGPESPCYGPPSTVYRPPSIV
jgi:hypothetical protein